MEHLKYSTGLKRVGAAIVDDIVFWPLALVMTNLQLIGMPQGMLHTANYILVLLPVTYSIYCHYKYGMTIGKWVAKIKVIDVSETRAITLKQAVMRDIFLVIMTLVEICINILQNVYWTEGDYPQSIHWLSMVADSAWFIWTLLEIISMLTNRRRRAIHDFIAGTVVVRSDVFERMKLMNESFKNAEGQ